MTRLKVAAHVHSAWSYDAEWSLPDIARAFRRRGYDAVLMSEHDRSFDQRRWEEYQDACHDASIDGITLIPGIEYEDSDGVVHIPVWGSGVPFLGTGLPTFEVLRAAQDEGGVAVFAHPWRRNAISRYQPEWAPLLSAVEIWNRKYDGIAPNRAAARLAARAELGPFATLDFHTSRQFFPLAMAFELDEEPSADSLAEAIRKGFFTPQFLGVSALRFTGGIEGATLRALETARRGLRGALHAIRLHISYALADASIRRYFPISCLVDTRSNVAKVLLITSVDAEDVGEALFGYHWVRGLAAKHDVTVLSYYKHGRPPASKHFPGLRIIDWLEPPLIWRAERLNSMLLPGYIRFYIGARRWIRQRLAEGERFDVAFQPVPVALRYPSPVAGLGIPFVVGPLGGSLPTPPGFSTEDKAPWYMQLRRLDGLRLQYDRRLRETYQGAECVFGIAPYVEDVLSSHVRLKRFEVMFDVGIEALPEPVNRAIRKRHAIRVLFVGRVVRTKGVRDAIRALGMAKELPVVFDIVGDGFDRQACETLAAELGLTDKVRFHGWIPRDRVNDFYRDADIFLFPSFREPGGAAVLEAMSYGLPLIVSSIGGPGYAVDDSAGIRLRTSDPERYAADIATALTKLVTDRDIRLTLGEGARQRVAELALWENRINRVDALLNDIVRNSA